MVVDAVNTLDEQLPLDMIGIKKVQGEPYSFTPHTGEKIHATRNSRKVAHLETKTTLCTGRSDSFNERIHAT